MIPELVETPDFRIFFEVFMEEIRQDGKWGADRTMPSTDSRASYSYPDEKVVQAETDLAAEHHRLTWDHVLLEEIVEVHEAKDWTSRRKELIQVAAVIFQEIKSNDKRAKETKCLRLK